MSDIKMSEVFYLPLTNKHGVVEDDSGMFVADLSSVEMDEAMCHAINNYDPMALRIKDLEFSLDDRDCYITDADMKNEALVKQVAELRAALGEALAYVDADFEGKLKPCNPAHLGRVISKALELSE